MRKLDIIKSILQNIIDQIDNGTCNMSDDEIETGLDMRRRYANPEQKLSKEQACKKLGISRATFDNHVRSGKIPRGKDQVGFKEKFWTNKDISNKL